MINAFLKNVSNDKKSLKNVSISFDDLPSWFKERNALLNYTEKEKFIKNVCEEPSLHLVFKNKEYKKNLKNIFFLHPIVQVF